MNLLIRKKRRFSHFLFIFLMLLISACQKEALNESGPVAQAEKQDAKGELRGPQPSLPCVCWIRIDDIVNADEWVLSTNDFCNDSNRLRFENALCSDPPQTVPTGVWFPFNCALEPGSSLAINFESFVLNGDDCETVLDEFTLGNPCPYLEEGQATISLVCYEGYPAASPFPGPVQHQPDLTFTVSSNSIPGLNDPISCIANIQGTVNLCMLDNCNLQLIENGDTCN